MAKPSARLFCWTIRACVFLTALGASVYAAPGAPRGPHTFTDVQGNSAPAEVVSLVGDTVNLQRSDGKDWSAPLASFVPEDQLFIVETLIQQRLARNDPIFSMTAIPIRANENSHPITGGAVQTWTEFYKITLKNETSMKLSGLRVRTIVFRVPLVPDITAGYNIVVDLHSQTYLLDDIGDHTTKTVATDPLTMQSIQSRNGYFPAAAGAYAMADRLMAIWVRVYDSHDFLIQEWCSMPEILKQGKWDDTWAKGGGSTAATPAHTAGIGTRAGIPSRASTVHVTGQ
ncbi:MAG TPA: hypothetical protein VK737_00555 [Opitutales bacterium]|jgi:hypothetical protein|nr:hypothetical protein [Opitutales bacterium]